jgi:amino acid transporter
MKGSTKINLQMGAVFIVLVIAFVFFVGMAVQSMAKLGKHLDENGGVKAAVEQVWCGKEGCDDTKK